jgi:adenylosuccinate lyase
VGAENPLVENLCRDAKLAEYLSEKEIRNLMTTKSHIGDAPERARKVVKEIQAILKNA